MNIVLYKNAHCTFLLHYPLSNHAVVTRTMKSQEFCLLLLDIYNLVQFLCSGRQVIGLCDSHKSSYANKETSELKGYGTLSRAAKGTFKKSLTSPFLNLNLSTFVVSPKFHFSLNSWGCGVFTYNRGPRSKGRCTAYQS